MEPLGDRVLVRKDEDRKVTKVGIHLPDKIEIPTITGRVVAISAQIDRDEEIRIPVFDIFDDNFRLNSIKVVKQFLVERCQKKSITIVELLQFCVYSQLILSR